VEELRPGLEAVVVEAVAEVMGLGLVVPMIQL